MKKLRYLLLFTLLMIFCTVPYGFAAPAFDLPTTLQQPNGAEVEAFVTGDEFFRYIHDASGRIIVQDGATGFYCYAKLEDGQPVSSGTVVGGVSLFSFGTVGIKAEDLPREYTERYLNVGRRLYNSESGAEQRLLRAPSEKSVVGTRKNVVIFIRFSDSVGDFKQSWSGYYNEFFNGAGSESTTSLNHYYKINSYNNIVIQSVNANDVTSVYTDPHPRGYYGKYDEALRPDGYKNTDEEDARLNELLSNAAHSVRNSAVWQGADCITFIVQGNADTWNSLLWPHSYEVKLKTTLGGKARYRYALTCENGRGDSAENDKLYVMCHEMGHIMGAPDLYIYNDGFKSYDPCGSWDLMGNGYVHMTSYIKWKYFGWAAVPEITENGRYTIKSVGSSSVGQSYKIQSSAEDEYFMVEYRRKEDDMFEAAVPGSGVIVYRIKSGIVHRVGESIITDSGNTYATTPSGVEMYIYRKNGTLNSRTALGSNAVLSEIGRGTNPEMFLSDGSFGEVTISNIMINSVSGTASFDVYIGDISPSSSLDITHKIKSASALRSGNKYTASLQLELTKASAGSENADIICAVTDKTGRLIHVSKHAETISSGYNLIDDFDIKYSDDYPNDGHRLSVYLWESNGVIPLAAACGQDI